MPFLTDKEITIIEKIVEVKKDHTLNEGKDKKAYTTGLDQLNKNILYKLVKPYVEQDIGNFNIHIAMILKEFTPWSVHTDYQKGDKNPGHAILIPLETINSHTIIFNEESTELFDFKKHNLCKLSNSCANLHEKYLSHVPKEILEYLSLQKIEKWEKGKIIVWDRKLLHASDNFLANGVLEKKAVVIFTSRI